MFCMNIHAVYGHIKLFFRVFLESDRERFELRNPARNQVQLPKGMEHTFTRGRYTPSGNRTPGYLAIFLKLERKPMHVTCLLLPNAICILTFTRSHSGASPTVKSCYVNIFAFTNRENNKLLKK